MSFKVIAIRPLKGCNKQFLKNLKTGEFYTFYNEYTFKRLSNESLIDFTYEKLLPDDFFNVKRPNGQILPVSISAIAGKNGSGKSSITELIYVSFYNLAVLKGIIERKPYSDAPINFGNDLDDLFEHIKKQIVNYNEKAQDEIQGIELKKDIDNLIALKNNLQKLQKWANPPIHEELKCVDNINLQVIFKNDLEYYVIHFRDNSAKFYQIPQNGNHFKIDVADETIVDQYSALEKDGLFYNLVINYSFHSLNSNESGDWIENIFHKNDGYQTPVVLNPFRDEGTMNVNTENHLVRSRLLVNVLKEGKAFLNVTEFNRIHEIIVTPDQAKNKKNDEWQGKRLANLVSLGDIAMDKIFEIFIDKDIRAKYKVNLKYNSINSRLDSYISGKFMKIIRQYKTYEKYLGLDIFKPEKSDFLLKLQNDKSHVTLKLKQAIHYLYFNNLDDEKEDTIYKYFENHSNRLEPLQLNIITLSRELKDRSKESKIDLLELLPPSFLYIDYVFENGGIFSHLSSGEKQKIYTINSLLYHLSNLNSVHENKSSGDLIAYSNVNIVFDEIELYYHPEMQRGFINELTENLSKLNIKNIKALNFIFITHSPFILSDIPVSNIMFLDVIKEKKEIFAQAVQQHNYKTDSLTFGANIHDLLTDGFFMRNGFMGEFAKRKINDLIAKLSSEDNYTLREEADMKLIIEQIGEPLLRKTMKDLFFTKFDDQLKLKKEIEMLTKKLRQ